jgi:U4/U6.U5 tri-snRNP-associated protein 2
LPTICVQFVLHPRYTRELVTKLDSIALPSHALDGSVYYPGVVGLNNIKNNDYINAVVHSLAHVRPLRDFFLLEENYRDVRTSPPRRPPVSLQRCGYQQLTAGAVVYRRFCGSASLTWLTRSAI